MKKINLVIVFSLFSFFILLNNVKAYPTYDSPYTTYNEDHFSLIAGNSGGKDYYQSIDNNFTTDAVGTSSAEATKQNWESNGYGAYLQHNLADTPYYSKGPKGIYNVQKNIDGNIYQYSVIIGQLNGNVNSSGGFVNPVPSNPSRSLINFLGDYKDMIDSLEDIYHIGYTNDWVLANSNGEKVTEINLDELIYNWNYWANIPGILPLGYLYIDSSNNVQYDTSSENTYFKFNRQIWGINNKFIDDNKVVTATVEYPIWVFKFKIGEEKPTCYYDTENNQFIGAAGNVITAEGNRYGIDNNDYIQETFINECLCDTYNNTKLNEDLYKELESSLSSNAKNYYKTFCPDPNTETTTPERGINICEPKMSDRDCKDTNKFSVGYIDNNGNLNENCLYGTTNIDKTVYDANDTTNRNNLTYATNEYCSLTCAEKIDFELPTTIQAVTAGKYWKWNDDAIKLTGTRKCQATVAIDSFESDLNNTLSSALNIRTANIYNTTKSKAEANNNSNYGLIQQLQDLNAIYQDYTSITDTKASASSVCPKCPPMGGPCSYDTQYTYISITGEVFTRIKHVGGTCDESSYASTTSGKAPSTIAQSIITPKFEEVQSDIETKIGEVNTCTDDLKTKTSNSGMSTYEFEPTVTFAYEDLYNISFGNNTINSNNNPFNTILSSDKLETRNVQENKDKTMQYLTSIGSNDLTSKQYYSSPGNNYVYTKERTYASSIYFYLENSKFNSGSLSYEYSETIPNDINKVDQDYYLGNIYPISLNVQTGEKNYHLYFSNLGVAEDGTNSSRFNKLLNNNKALDYTCYYNVENDVTSPNKPNFFYRNISLNKFNPNSRDLGKNWTNAKATATLDEIEKTGTTDDPEEIYNNPEYSFTLTPTNMQNIRTYNRGKEKDNGKGYADWNMTKVDSTDSDTNGKSLDDYVWHTSNFLRGNECGECFERKVLNDNWTKWTGSYAKITEQNDETKDTGPAWK